MTKSWRDKISANSPPKMAQARFYCSVLLILLLLITGLTLIGSIRKEAAIQDGLLTVADIAAATFASKLPAGEAADFAGALKAFENNSAISAVALFDDKDNLLAGFNAQMAQQTTQFATADNRHSGMRTVSAQHLLDSWQLYLWVNNHFGQFKQISLAQHLASALELDGKNLHLLRPIFRESRQVGSLYLAAPFSRKAIFVNYFRDFAGIILLFATGLGLLVRIFIKKTVDLPLKELSASLEVANQNPTNPAVALPGNHSPLYRLALACQQIVQRQQQLSELLAVERATASVGQEQAGQKLALLNGQLEELQTALQHAIAEKLDAEQANQRKAEFLANMSHEIRTPMTAVLGMADFLWHSNLKPDQRRSIEVMKQTSTMLISIVDDIIDFAKIESGSLSLNKSEFNCHELLTDSYQLLALEAKAKGLKYRLEIAAEFPFLMIGDAGRISQILVNLLSNAIKFTAQGEIKMRVTGTANGNKQMRLLCEVTDTGIGINKDKLALLFNAFNQTDTALTRIFPGTGLGLAISKQLIQLMAGEIGVSSQPGIGSTFWFRLDLAVSSTPVKSLKQRNNYRFNARLLVAEDYPANQMVAQRFLEDLGCKVVMVNNGFEAVKALKNQAFDLVFMDCQMPFMDGYQATQEIRRLNIVNRNDQPIPVIALTAHALQEDENRCKAAGMDEWVTKPFTRHDLSKTLQKWLPKELVISDQPALKTDVVTLAKASNIMDDTSSINIKFFTQQFKLDNIDDLAFISSLTNAFQQNAAQVLSNLQLSLDNQDIENIRKLAHGLKSISTNVGSGSLTDLCSLMEQSAQNGEADGLQELLESMKHEYLRVLAELNSLCARA